MKACVVIPIFNHASSIAEVVRGARLYCPVIVVDDGSTEPFPAPADAALIRFDQNRGKGAALRAGFSKAVELGYTHAISMDADDQHCAADIPKFLTAATAAPAALLVGVRDFVAAGAPAGRRRSNRLSSFWFQVATNVRLADTQCGFRCYPLAEFQKLRITAERYAFELESLARAAWGGIPLVGVPVGVRYTPELVRGSHFRPLVDFVRITNLQIGLVLQAWLVPAELRRAWSLGQNRTKCQVAASFFSENAHEPIRLAGAVGWGLFCGIAPIWGFQAAAALAGAHRWRLNKASAVLASNISFPPFAPFIVYGSLVLGNFVLTGQRLSLSAHDVTRARILQYFGTWLLGSVLLALIAGLSGLAITYCIARLFRRR